MEEEWYHETVSQPALSIVIPTFRRGVILRECLHRIELQTIRDQLEVLVVSDGAMDKETALLAKESFQLPVTFLEVPKSQQGVARNRGVAAAKGEYVLFIGDDIFLGPAACERHMRAHTDHPGSAVLGHMTWDPALQITPVMRWLERTGWELGYGFLEPYRHAFVPTDMQQRFTYGGNISLPLAAAKAFPFKENVSVYGWEDIEWGRRLKDAGVRLYYEPDAKAYHHHTFTLTDSLRRMETLGEAAVLMESMNADMRLTPRGWKCLAYRVLSLLPTLRGVHAKAFLSGIVHGEEGQKML